MNRNLLIDLIRNLAEKAEWSFVSGEAMQCAVQFKGQPLLWLAPVELAEAEGRRRGRLTYAVELHALQAGAKRSPAEREAVAGAAEEVLLDLFTQLSTHPQVVAVEELTIRPACGRYTPHGEISQTATAQVVTHFKKS